MRTISIVGCLFAGILILTLLYGNVVAIGVVMLVHVACLVALARDADMEEFIQKNVRNVHLLEIAMYAAAITGVTSYANGVLWPAVMATLVYGVCFGVLVKASPPYIVYRDRGMFDDIHIDAE